MKQPIEKTLNQPYIFFDQNVMNKMLKQKHKSFQDNVYKLITEKRNNFILQITPFGLVELSGLNIKEILSIQYKDEKISKYLFHSYKEIDHKDFVFELTEQIREKIKKSFLKEKLKTKRRNSQFLNPQGVGYIDECIKSIDDSMYDLLVRNLLLDRVSQVNTSQFSIEERKRFVSFLLVLTIDVICTENIMGSYRIVCKVLQEVKKIAKNDKLFQKFILFDIAKQMDEIRKGLKASGDLVDCELVHVAFFGFKNHSFYCYTTDSEEIILSRLRSYCKYVDVLIYLFFDRKKFDYQYSQPEWRCGKVFILNRDTGEKVKEISTNEIYEQVLNVRRRFTQ